MQSAPDRAARFRTGRQALAPCRPRLPRIRQRTPLPGSAELPEALGQPRLFAFTTKGSRAFHEVAYQRDDAFLFGPESRGLPEDVRNALPTDRRLRLPMREGCRSLNLSNTVAVTVYEAWRQLGFAMD